MYQHYVYFINSDVSHVKIVYYKWIIKLKLEEKNFTQQKEQKYDHLENQES